MIPKKHYLCPDQYISGMKKFLLLVLTALTLSSCFKDDATYSAEYYVIATFEYNLAGNDFFGSDSLFFDVDYGLGIGWGDDMAFYHKLNDEKTEFKGGFMLSRLKGSVAEQGKDPDPVADLYRANAPADSTDTYLVYHQTDVMPVHDVEFVTHKYGTCTMIGCDVTVPGYVAYAVSENFTDGDRLTLTATGYNDGTKTGEVSIDLASCADGKVTVLSMWKTLDLSKLGAIQYIEFEVESTSDSVPEAFCLDNMLAKVKIEY